MPSRVTFTAEQLELFRAAFTAMDQTYGLTQPGFTLQPIDNSGQGKNQPWQTPEGWRIVESIDGSNFGGKFVLYKNDTTKQVMVVPMGTNGNKDVKGWSSNLAEYGFSQWERDVTDQGGRVQDL